MITRRMIWCVALASLILWPAVAVAQRAQDRLELEGAPLGGPPLSCGVFAEYQQPLDPASFGGAYTSDLESGFQALEASVSGGVIVPLTNFGPAVSGVRVWGGSFDFGQGAECLGDNTALTPYDFTIYADAGGAPGAVLGTTSAAPTAITNTGIPFGPFFFIHEYDFNFAPLDATGASWLAIERQAGVPGCFFVWINETDLTTYDNFLWQNPGGGVPDQDFTYCLAMGAVPTMPNWAMLALLVVLLAIPTVLLRRRQNA